MRGSEVTAVIIRKFVKSAKSRGELMGAAGRWMFARASPVYVSGGWCGGIRSWGCGELRQQMARMEQTYAQHLNEI